MLRYTRIAFSVVCGLVCVLLVVLWVRTHFAIDNISGPLASSTGFGITSRHDGVGLVINSGYRSQWRIVKYPPNEDFSSAVDYETVLGFVQYQTMANGFRIRVPYWSLILLSAISGGLPWLSYRFSLRTLLIATTVIAAVLGLVVWLSS